jgi:hypothetical protein
LFLSPNIDVTPGTIYWQMLYQMINNDIADCLTAQTQLLQYDHYACPLSTDITTSQKAGEMGAGHGKF